MKYSVHMSTSFELEILVKSLIIGFFHLKILNSHVIEEGSMTRLNKTTSSLYYGESNRLCPCYNPILHLSKRNIINNFKKKKIHTKINYENQR